MDKILLVHCCRFSPFDQEKKFNSYIPPLGIGYIGAYLRKNGFEVKLVDLSLLNGWSEFILILEDEMPNIVGLSAMTSEVELAYTAAKIIHQTIEDVTVILGGPHATVLPEDALASQYIDIVAVGEGEITFFELVRALKGSGELSTVEGILYKDSNGIKTNKPRSPIKHLDNLPFPLRDMIGNENFQRHAYKLLFLMSYPYINIMVSRGCYGQCSMCQPTLNMIFGKGVRYRSVANVIEEVKVLKKKYKIRSVIFWDDTFTTNKKWLVEFCEQLTEEKLNITWWCYARVNTVDKEILKKMKKAGCRMICFGIESGSQRILKEILHKGISVEESRNAISLCKEMGILANANVMIGSPTETIEEVRLTDKLLTESKPEIIWAAVTSPLPGTILGDDVKRKGLILSENWSEYIRGYSGKPKIKTEISFETISFYQTKWHTSGFKWQYLLESQYIKACLIRCWCHIAMGYFSRICEEFFPLIKIKEILKKISFVRKVYWLLKR